MKNIILGIAVAAVVSVSAFGFAASDGGYVMEFHKQQDYLAKFEPVTTVTNQPAITTTTTVTNVTPVLSFVTNVVVMTETNPPRSEKPPVTATVSTATNAWQSAPQASISATGRRR